MHLQIIVFACFLSHVSSVSKSGDAYYEYLRAYYQGPIHLPCDDSCGEYLILTPLINDNKLDEAKAAAYVTPNLLPGVKSYSGFFTVNEEYNSNLWFLFVPAINRSVTESPLLVSISGGPAAPSAYEIFLEFGPFALNSKNEIKGKPYTWNANHSILYFSSPVGSGFSFTEDEKGYSTNETIIGKELYIALQQFLTLFSELRSVPVYLIGELYATKHVVELGYQIYNHRRTDDPINLQGLLLNNGILDMGAQLYGADFALQTVLITEEDAANMKKYKKSSASALKRGNTIQAFNLLNKAGSILRSSSMVLSLSSTGAPPFENVMRFIQQPKIRRSLHVGNATFYNIEKAYDKLVPDLMNNVTCHLQLLLNNYKFLALVGAMSQYTPPYLTEKYYEKLKFRDAKEYLSGSRRYFMYNNTVAGYYRQSRNFITLYLRLTGNRPFLDKPDLTLSIISSFFANNTL